MFLFFLAIESYRTTESTQNRKKVSVASRPLALPILFFLCVFSAPFLGRALLQGGISARNICLFRADLLPLLLAKMCQLFLFLFCPLDFCSLCGFCSLCAPDTTFSALCTALVAVVFTAFTTSRFMSGCLGAIVYVYTRQICIFFFACMIL